MSTIDTLRSYRIGSYAIFDFVASFAGVYLIVYLINTYEPKTLKRYTGLAKIDMTTALLLTIPFGVLVHVLTGTDTALNRDLFGPGKLPIKAGVAGLIGAALYRSCN